MLIYLDNCCFNRPFDDQRHLRIRLEAEAKLTIQEVIREGRLRLAWSYVLDFENAGNPFAERRERIREWRSHAAVDCVGSADLEALAAVFVRMGLRNIDALHVACAVQTGCAYFITTDDQVLGRAATINKVQITDPIGFIRKELP